MAEPERTGTRTGGRAAPVARCAGRHGTAFNSGRSRRTPTVDSTLRQCLGSELMSSINDGRVDNAAGPSHVGSGGSDGASAEGHSQDRGRRACPALDCSSHRRGVSARRRGQSVAAQQTRCHHRAGQLRERPRHRVPRDRPSVRRERLRSWVSSPPRPAARPRLSCASWTPRVWTAQRSPHDPWAVPASGHQARSAARSMFRSTRRTGRGSSGQRRRVGIPIGTLARRWLLERLEGE